MNANPEFLNQSAHVDEAAVKPLPNSRKIYVQGFNVINQFLRFSREQFMFYVLIRFDFVKYQAFFTVC